MEISKEMFSQWREENPVTLEFFKVIEELIIEIDAMPIEVVVGKNRDDLLVESGKKALGLMMLNFQYENFFKEVREGGNA